ncbi:hypothetical protein RKAS3_11510 [Rhodoluna sp. KAS3]|nr:hypothetical protein RKAS3_11510 [Rhodoluna sp. KAS3]
MVSMRWILKRFWFPILLIVLSLLGRKYPWALKAKNTIMKFSDPIQTVRSAAKGTAKK